MNKKVQEVLKDKEAVESLGDKPEDKVSPEELEEKWKQYHETEGSFIRNLKDAIAKLYAGKTLPVERNYIALISRHTAKPICKIDVAQSATGKTKAADTALLFVSPRAYHKVDSASPTAVVYNKEQYEHRLLVFGEIDSIPEDGVMASALRALITEGELIHEVTERSEGGKFVVRRIKKRGPTGFLSTSTRSPRTQLATRTLVSGVDDSKEQTRLVMKRIAQDFGDGVETPDMEPFLAYDQWLEGNRCPVKIPYASILAEVLPDEPVRMRRDITQLYRVIETITLINQPHREVKNGKLVATLKDYEYARYLLADLFEDIVRGGITPKVREAVNAVATLYRENQAVVTTAQVGELMKIDRTTAAYHCKKATESEYIENESPEGKPYKMKPGQPLPEDTSVLPTVKDLAAYMSGITIQRLNTQPKPEYNAARADIGAGNSKKPDVEDSTVEPAVESLSSKVGGKVSNPNFDRDFQDVFGDDLNKPIEQISL